MITIMLNTIRNLFTCSDTCIREIEAGETLFRAGDPITHMALVQQGQIHLLRHTRIGNVVVLQRARAHDVLAEASAWSDVYHCDAHVVLSGSVLLLPVQVLRKRLVSEPALTDAWFAYLTQTIQAARFCAEIRTLKTVEERLDAWIDEYGPLPAKGQYQEVAADLGVSREALYRELSRRRQLN